MPAVKKFGTFNGVFTPAILTILGVIMYLRLPSIVGQAGLYSAVGIILVAHIISITTGLSVSSIATDKRVKTGGTYYMISRSLGLPIGGTLGLALFVGLSFSVSLYLIGFSESFLGFWGIEVTKNTIRLAGTIALVGVTVITFISTSLALKTQFFILVAIILSLVSIFLGKSPEVPQSVHLYPIAGAAPFIVLFGIFFPAVTGFEAGVSMSGDLANPKKSIPGGTIAAIAVGLIVYIGLAIFFSYRVSADQLVNNPNVLLDFSIFPPLVLAGIWGATLSSAMGSILGAPRILQAISIDKITPRFFGVGYGKENEPRNALLLTFVIAEAGILVGELDVIARVVSMFFITTYGFLNLSCAIENWASPDFRPEFRVSKFVSIIGSITCLVVMIQLDLIAMIAATVLLASLFFYLKRKELTLETGDTWEGVWSSVIRAGLDYLNKGNLQQRNWRPNIILFSGGISARPHLLDLGTRLVDKRGMLSAFDLLEVEGSKLHYSKSEQSVKVEHDTTKGIYLRRVECEDVYEAMETISKYYGFSGIEPNTVLMGWGRNSSDPEKLVHTIKTIAELDYNLLMLNYDENRGFGKHEKIDIWWRGMGNMISFATTLCRFLTSSDEWQDAEIRFLMIANKTFLIEKLHQTLHQIADDFRIDATIKIVNNAIEQKPFFEIIQRESSEADLIINGIPHIPPGEESLYVSKTNAILENLGTVLLVRASSFFQEVYSLNLSENQLAVAEVEPGESQETTGIEDSIPVASDFQAQANLKENLHNIHSKFESTYLAKLQESTEKPVQIIQELTDTIVNNLNKHYSENERFKNLRMSNRSLGDFLYQLHKRLEDQLNSSKQSSSELMEEAVSWSIRQIKDLQLQLPERLKIVRDDNQLLPIKNEKSLIRLEKFIKRQKKRFLKRQIESSVQYRKLSELVLDERYWKNWYGILCDLNIYSMQSYADAQKSIDSILDGLGQISNKLASNTEFDINAFTLSLEAIKKSPEELAEQQKKRWQKLPANLDKLAIGTVAEINKDLLRYDSHHRFKHHRKIKRLALKTIETILETPEHWSVNHQVMLKTLLSDLNLLTFKNRISAIIKRKTAEFRSELDQVVMADLKFLSQQLQHLIAGEIPIGEFKNSTVSCFRKPIKISDIWEKAEAELRSIVNDLNETVESVQQESLEAISSKKIEALTTVEISLRRKIEFVIESVFLGPLEEEIEKMSRQLARDTEACIDVLRLLSISLTEDGTVAESGLAGFESLELIVRDSSERLQDIEESILSIAAGFEQFIEKGLRESTAAINLFSLSETDGTAITSLKSSTEFWLARQIKAYWKNLKSKTGSILTNMLYNRSILSLQTQKADSPVQPVPKTEQLIEFVESVSPRPEVSSGLPFYYRHLFLGKPTLTKDFWIGRSEEIHSAAKAIKRFKNGNPGGVAIIGPPGSGKTALCQMIANRYFDRQKTWVLNPPSSSNCDVNLFETRLSETLGLSPSESLKHFKWPNGSVLILDDISGWWQRHENGLKVMERMIELLRSVGNQCLILLNTNDFTFRLLQQLVPFDPFLLDVIECRPMSIKELKEIIMVRHHSTGLTFSFKGFEEDKMSGWATARLFTKCLNGTSGNIGAALKQWICNIDSIKKESIDLVLQQKPDLSVLNLLNANQLILLIQFFLHRKLTRSALSSIMKLEPVSLEMELQYLIRSGIVVSATDNVLELEPFISDYLFEHLIQKGIL